MEVNGTRNCLVTDILLNINKKWLRKKPISKKVEYLFKHKYLFSPYKH